MHENMKGRGDKSEYFKFGKKKAVKDGDSLSLLLFIIYMDKVLKYQKE